MRQLKVCAGCGRHVYVSDQACPFCGGEHRKDLSGRVPKGLSRAATHAARAALLLGAAGSSGCYLSHGLGEETDGGAADMSVVDVPLIDVPLTDTGRPDARVVDAGLVDAAEADAPEDVGDDIDTGAPIYGGVFPDPRKRAIV